MDETPVYFDMSGGFTLTTKGSKDVLQKTTGHDKLRFTVVLCVSASGKELPPMIIFKNLKAAPKLTTGQSWPKGKCHKKLHDIPFCSDEPVLNLWLGPGFGTISSVPTVPTVPR